MSTNDSHPWKTDRLLAPREALQAAGWRAGGKGYGQILRKIYRMRREVEEAEYAPIECSDCQVPIQEDHTCPSCGCLVVEDDDSGNEIVFPDR